MGLPEEDTDHFYVITINGLAEIVPKDVINIAQGTDGTVLESVSQGPGQ